MWNIWTGDRWGQLRLWPAKRSLETENILYEFIYISWELCEDQNRKDAQKREIWGHQIFLVVLNYARLHYKLVVQLKSNMKYYPRKSTGQSKSTWGKTKGQFDLNQSSTRETTRIKDDEKVCHSVYMFILTTAILGSWERQHAKKLCFIKVLRYLSSPLCFLATTPSSNKPHTPICSPTPTRVLCIF